MPAAEKLKPDEIAKLKISDPVFKNAYSQAVSELKEKKIIKAETPVDRYVCAAMYLILTGNELTNDSMESLLRALEDKKIPDFGKDAFLSKPILEHLHRFEDTYGERYYYLINIKTKIPPETALFEKIKVYRTFLETKRKKQKTKHVIEYFKGGKWLRKSQGWKKWAQMPVSAFDGIKTLDELADMFALWRTATTAKHHILDFIFEKFKHEVNFAPIRDEMYIEDSDLWLECPVFVLYTNEKNKPHYLIAYVSPPKGGTKLISEYVAQTLSYVSIRRSKFHKGKPAGEKLKTPRQIGKERRDAWNESQSKF